MCRIGDWKLFCQDRRFQPLVFLFTIVFTVIASGASIYSAWFAKPNRHLIAPLNGAVRAHFSVFVDGEQKQLLAFTLTSWSRRAIEQRDPRIHRVSTHWEFKACTKKYLFLGSMEVGPCQCRAPAEYWRGLRALDSRCPDCPASTTFS